jgi:hypothetical protein
MPLHCTVLTCCFFQSIEIPGRSEGHGVGESGKAREHGLGGISEVKGSRTSTRSRGLEEKIRDVFVLVFWLVAFVHIQFGWEQSGPTWGENGNPEVCAANSLAHCAVFRTRGAAFLIFCSLFHGFRGKTIRVSLRSFQYLWKRGVYYRITRPGDFRIVCVRGV